MQLLWVIVSQCRNVIVLNLSSNSLINLGNLLFCTSLYFVLLWTILELQSTQRRVSVWHPAPHRWQGSGILEPPRIRARCIEQNSFIQLLSHVVCNVTCIHAHLLHPLTIVTYVCYPHTRKCILYGRNVSNSKIIPKQNPSGIWDSR